MCTTGPQRDPSNQGRDMDGGITTPTRAMNHVAPHRSRPTTHNPRHMENCDGCKARSVPIRPVDNRPNRQRAGRAPSAIRWKTAMGAKPSQYRSGQLTIGRIDNGPGTHHRPSASRKKKIRRQIRCVISHHDRPPPFIHSRRPPRVSRLWVNVFATARQTEP